jgi:hypothetical protein
LDAPELVAEYEHGLSQRQLHYAAAFVVTALEGSEAGLHHALFLKF